jgi:hypothetical protein
MLIPAHIGDLTMVQPGQDLFIDRWSDEFGRRSSRRVTSSAIYISQHRVRPRVDGGAVDVGHVIVCAVTLAVEDRVGMTGSNGGHYFARVNFSSFWFCCARGPDEFQRSIFCMPQGQEKFKAE